MKQIYIAASGEHMGKTTCTLGLSASLKEMGINVGYCKPVGQKHMVINDQLADKDAVLFGSALDFEVEPEIHSPVILASGVTANYIDNPEKFNFKEDILRAKALLESKHEAIVFEGTGHPGVGSIIDFSNAAVAKLLGADVILIVQGGIGRTIDRLNISMALFREEGVNIRGVIINKVHEDKLERVKHYNAKKLKQMGIPLLGVLPYDRTLSFPIMHTVCKAVKGKVVFNGQGMGNQIEEILAGSLIEIDEFTYLRNILLVVNQSRFREALNKIKQQLTERKLEEPPLSGIIITGDGRHNKWYTSESLMDSYIDEHQIPVITTTYDTYDTVVKISQIEVKINTQTPWKVKRAIQLIQDNIDVEKLYNEL